jgi:hypothetical protein
MYRVTPHLVAGITVAAVALSALAASTRAQAYTSTLMGHPGFVPPGANGPNVPPRLRPMTGPLQCFEAPADLVDAARGDKELINAIEWNALLRCPPGMTSLSEAELRANFAKLVKAKADAAEARAKAQAEAKAQGDAAETKRVADLEVRQAEYQRQVAEQQAKAEAEAKQRAAEQAEQQRLWQEAKRQEAIEAAKPVNKLRDAYRNYVVTQTCYKARNGYLVTWVNDVEMERARKAMHDLEALYLKQDPSINKEQVWKSVLTSVSVQDVICQNAVHRLINQWSDTGNSDFNATRDF